MARCRLKQLQCAHTALLLMPPPALYHYTSAKKCSKGAGDILHSRRHQLRLTLTVPLPQRWSCCPEIPGHCGCTVHHDANVYCTHCYRPTVYRTLLGRLGVEFWTFFGLKDGGQLICGLTCTRVYTVHID